MNKNPNSSNQIVLVGCGNMGRAMLEGWIATNALSKDEVVVVEPASSLAERVKELGVKCVSDTDQLPSDLQPKLIIFAVKPQIMFDVTPAYTGYVAKGSAVLSVAAGITTQKFADQFGSSAAIIRVMPNTPAAISKGMMVIYNNAHVSVEQRTLVEKLMSASGAITTIDDEAQMDAVTAVSGSGPAYVFHLIEALTDAGVHAGLPQDTSKLLAEQTIYGAAIYAKQSGQAPGTLREQVTSPNGTTAAALNVLMEDDALKNLMVKAVDAAKKRSEELG